MTDTKVYCAILEGLVALYAQTPGTFAESRIRGAFESIKEECLTQCDDDQVPLFTSIRLENK